MTETILIFSRYWAPIQWSINIIYDCKVTGTIDDFYIMTKIVEVRKVYIGISGKIINLIILLKSIEAINNLIFLC